MGAVSHTNPYTGATAGQLFSRGPTVRADGGTPADEQEEPERNRPMKDVSHTPPNDAEDANRVFERGGTEDAGRQPVERVE